MDPPDLAIALRWEQGEARPPRVVAKGKGALARAVVDAAENAGVAVRRDPELAAALSALEIDQDIPPALFAAVAEIIAALLAKNAEAAP